MIFNKKIILFVLLMLGSVYEGLCQGPPPPPPPFSGCGPCVSINNGLFLLAGAGLMYIIIKLSKDRSKNRRRRF